jgi:hypothetical protein
LFNRKRSTEKIWIEGNNVVAVEETMSFAHRIEMNHIICTGHYLEIEISFTKR